ncbi:hypothetical protein KSS87_016463 [Heliosperma pusillum]|nr:hypothetical protein KSS87_016463 [Heliosperma pusillum]
MYKNQLSYLKASKDDRLPLLVDGGRRPESMAEWWTGGIMDVRVGLLVLIVFAGNCVSDARNLAAAEDSDVEVAGKKIDVCTLCEQYVTVALDYIKDDKTQNEVLEALHKTCSQMHNLADQCVTMVDQYAETFFSEISSVQPEGFCKKVGLCRKPMVSSLPEKRDKCDVCHQAVNGVIDMLKDPDTELGIIERLLKACNAVGDRYKRKVNTENAGYLL